MAYFSPALRLHVELKPLLSTVNISLEFSTDVLTSTVKLSIEPHHVIVENEIHKIVFDLKDVTLDPETCRGLRWGSATELQFTVRVKGASDMETTMNGHNTHLSNQDLLVSRIQACQSRCYCVGCGAQILKSNCQFQRVLPLPSENWSDFADIWFCHNHSHKNVNTEEKGSSEPKESEDADIKRLKSTSLLPRSEDCLVSSLYMLADGCHFRSSSIVNCVDRLICKRCGNFLGFIKEKTESRNGGHHISGIFKIYFHAISFRTNEDVEESLPKEVVESFPVNNSQHRIEEFMCGLLKDKSHIFTSFRFILASSLQADNQSTISILIWLLDQNLTTFSSHVTHQEWSNTSTSSVTLSPSKHLKLLYKASFRSLKNSSESCDNQSSTVFQAWRKDNTVHAISLPYPLCKQLIHFLLSSTHELAPSQRSLNGFHVGYLKAG